MLKPTPPPWEWGSDGLYSDEFPILWVTQDVQGNLHLGVHEDDTGVLLYASALLAMLEKAEDWIAETLREETFSYDEDWDFLDELRDLIAKAKGC